MWADITPTVGQSEGEDPVRGESGSDAGSEGEQETQVALCREGGTLLRLVTNHYMCTDEA